ncbi:MAG: N-acetyltransferase [Meiothermus sp.]|nr:MAG: N-acetyltransferase [Meiothermus sp.]
MTPPPQNLSRIRPAQPEDLETMGRVAYLTGFFGESAAVYFPSLSLFRDLWIKPYLYGAGMCNWLAELDGIVVGYIVGASDTQVYRQYFLRSAFEMLKNAMAGKYPGLVGCVPYLLRAAWYSNRRAPAELYPAHLHINLLPQARGFGLGHQLLEAHLNCLRARGVRGVQLSTTRENDRALKLYEKFGFEVYIEWRSPLWKPWLGREATHLTLVKDLRAQY